MNEELKVAIQKSQVSMQAENAYERQVFKALTLSNPNYFGNLAESPFTPVLPISGNTYYEELACVGYQPQQERLEAVVYIYQPSGYGTDICGPGTPEFVRFYLSFDNGASWQDQGISSFQAHNIPQGTEGAKRLEYAASLAIHPARKLCFMESLVLVRAILSWNNPPPANQPNWKPVWGNVREAHIQIEPRRFIYVPELFEAAKVKLPPLVNQMLDPEAPIATQTKTLGAAELARQYKGKGVPPHRFAFKEIATFAQAGSSLGAESFAAVLPGITLDPGIISALFPKTDGDTSYEELSCIGLDPNHPDTLVGVIRVKKSLGYSGGPCTTGSQEYVTFWGDFDGNGSFETCLGTGQVRVYDLAEMPAQGVYYAVRVPVNLEPYRQACKLGPRVVRVRAILSWNVPVPCAQPNQVPAWGNRAETLINIDPVASAPAGKIAILGGIPVSMIGSLDGLTTSSAVFATNNFPPDSLGRPCPFGGRVTVQGMPLPGYSYKVEVAPAGGGAPSAVVTDLVLTRFDGSTFTHKANVATGRFDYVPFTDNVNSVLAQWDSTGDALWTVKLSVYNSVGALTGTDSHLIQLDNTWPDVALNITTGTGNCGKFPLNTLLNGTFVARDLNLGSYSLSVEPAVNPPGVGVPSPNAGLVNTAMAPGDSWTLDTTGMRPCGYIVRVVAVDRTIVNSQSVGHYSPASAGFCLEDNSAG